MERQNLKNILSNIANFCLTMDFWTSRTNTSYLGVTSHFIIDWKLHSRVLETLKFKISHTSKDIAENVKTVQLKWGLENKICAVVCDNAPNMIKAVTSLKREYLV